MTHRIIAALHPRANPTLSTKQPVFDNPIAEMRSTLRHLSMGGRGILRTLFSGK